VIYNFVGHIIRTVRLLVALSTNSSPQSVPVLFQKYVYKNAAIYIYMQRSKICLTMWLLLISKVLLNLYPVRK
jgi:hypothetical protein